MRVTGTFATGFGATAQGAPWHRPPRKQEPTQETKSPKAGPPRRRERRKNGLSGAAVQSVFAANLTRTQPDAASRIRAAADAMGGARTMTPELIEAELAARSQTRAWVFERRKGQAPRATTVEDAQIVREDGTD